ncbi:MAG: sulfotransferase [Oceanicaulis sp.]
MTAKADPPAVLQAAQRQMYEGAFSAALDTLEPLLKRDGGHTDALYMAAVCQRYLKRHDAALETLKRLRAASPDFGRGWQEEGHVHRDRGDAQRALAAYQAAVQINPALPAAWSNQAELLDKAGRPRDAAAARRRAEALQALPKALQAANHHLYENRLLKAEEICRAHLQANPKDVEAMRILAEIGTRLGVLEDAEFLLESAVEFAPDHVEARIDYVRILRRRQKYEKALDQAKQLYVRDPKNPVFVSQLAIERMQTGDYEKAVALFDEVLQSAPNDPATLTSRGHALKTWGKSAEAVASYQAAVTAAPGHGDAWYSLANLKTYEFSKAELDIMRAQEDAPGQPLQNRINLCFALAKACEDREAYEDGFAYYERGNALKKHQTRYTSEQMDAEFEAQKTVCSPALFAEQGGKGHEDPAPIFIVGLPRAGSTLIEQILASHSQVDGTLELPNILSLSHALRGRNKSASGSRYPEILHELDAETLAEYGRRYVEDTAIHRKGAPFFTDKMPNNFRHIGLIKLILPNAKIIDARRGPLDCCVSGFRQLFAEGQEFTYGLEEIGRYYRGYVDLMDHWDGVLPGEVLRVIHEDVVADLETQVRRMLDFLGLPFERACVEFHKTEREVRTASSEQVRQPINTKGLGQWRKYDAHLGPLKAALGPALEDWRRDAGAAPSTGAA